MVSTNGKHAKVTDPGYRLSTPVEQQDRKSEPPAKGSETKSEKQRGSKGSKKCETSLAPSESDRQKAWRALNDWLMMSRGVIEELRQTAYEIADEVESNPDGAVAQIVEGRAVNDLRRFADEISDSTSRLLDVTLVPPRPAANPLSAT